jgi:hypothetical protein
VLRRETELEVCDGARYCVARLGNAENKTLACNSKHFLNPETPLNIT